MYYLGALKNNVRETEIETETRERGGKGREGRRAYKCVHVCDTERMGCGDDALIIPMLLISNAMPACCNQDSFFFCMTIVKFSCGKSMFRFTIEETKYYVYCTCLKVKKNSYFGTRKLK